ncbi:MAG: hypothetical protein KC454_03185 [Flavobacteriales bacterium]|nr:hypothetical protein [Flavobacteriales bacterium]
MKKSYILGVTALASIGFLSMQNFNNASVENYIKSAGHQLNGGGAIQGVTGAPDENNCTQCHVGNAQDGSSQNVLTLLDGITPVTQYIPGNTYGVAVTMTSGNVQEGFSATALDAATDTKAGSFSSAGAIGTTVANGTRDYATHTSLSNTEGNPAWGWTWIAPATNVGEVIFYLSTNVTNGIGTAGDVVYISQHSFNTSVGLSETVSDKFEFIAGYSAESNKVAIKFNSLSVDNMYFNLVDMNGRSIFTYDLGESMIGQNEEQIALPSDIENGMYVVNFFVGNNPMSSKIMIAK